MREKAHAVRSSKRSARNDGPPESGVHKVTEAAASQEAEREAREWGTVRDVNHELELVNYDLDLVWFAAQAPDVTGMDLARKLSDLASRLGKANGQLEILLRERAQGGAS